MEENLINQENMHSEFQTGRLKRREFIRLTGAGMGGIFIFFQSGTAGAFLPD